VIAVRNVTEAHGPDSEFIRELARIFCEARKDRLQFQMDLHDEDEDRGFLSGVVLPTNRVWVAEIDGRPAGFIAFVDGWVNHLYIAPKFQRRGLGNRLLNIAKESSSSLQLWVFAVNGPAIQFYENEGFRIVERTDGTANEAKMPDVLMAWKNDLRL
jgi:ribosomal protein S18 acetylase RimI-like enzyme